MADFKKFNLIKTGEKEEGELQFLSKKEFEDLLEEKGTKEIELIGKTKLKKFTDKDKEKKDVFDYSILKIDESEDEYIINHKKNGKNSNIFHRTAGFFCVNKDTVEKNYYVRYYKLNLIILILFAVLFLGGVGGTTAYILNGGNFWKDASNAVNKVKDIVLDDDTVDTDDETIKNGKESKASSETIDLPGYGDLTVNSTDKEIPLLNPEINGEVNVYFKYTVMDAATKEVITETKYIKPGKAKMWNAYDDLTSYYGDAAKGKHGLVFHIQTIDAVKGTDCNGGKLSVYVTVE